MVQRTSHPMPQGPGIIGGTPVLGAHGPVRIEQVRVGDVLAGFEPRTGRMVPARVQDITTRIVHDVVQLGTDAGLLTVIPEQPLLVPSQRIWRTADALLPGDTVLMHTDDGVVHAHILDCALRHVGGDIPLHHLDLSHTSIFAGHLLVGHVTLAPHDQPSPTARPESR